MKLWGSSRDTNGSAARTTRRRWTTTVTAFAIWTLAFISTNIRTARAGNPSLSTGSAATNPNFFAASFGGVFAMGQSVIQYSSRYYPNGRVDPGVASNPNVAGIYLQYNWNSIETADGLYNWSQVDNEVNLAGAAGKKVVIGVAAGVASPSWLYNEGVQSFNIVWDRAWGYTPCSILKMPIPWNATFLTKWGAFVANFGARFDSNPNIVAVKLTGFNAQTPELFLPTAVNPPISINGYSCTGPNYVGNWQAVGYTRTLAESAWNQMTDDFVAAFPNTPLEAMTIPFAFPPFDQNGKSLAPSTTDKQALTDVIGAAIANYGQQFVLANNGLSASWIWPLEQGYANQINTGYQMLSSPMGSQLPGAVSLGLSAYPAFLEISDPDINNSALSATIATVALGLPR